MVLRAIKKNRRIIIHLKMKLASNIKVSNILIKYLSLSLDLVITDWPQRLSHGTGLLPIFLENIIPFKTSVFMPQILMTPFFLVHQNKKQYRALDIYSKKVQSDLIIVLGDTRKYLEKV